MPGPVIEELSVDEQLMDAIKEQMKLQVRFPFLNRAEYVSSITIFFLKLFCVWSRRKTTLLLRM